MNRTWNLKIFLSVSLGLHLFFISLTFILFPNVKMNPLQSLPVEISLLPLMAEEKPVSKVFPQKLKPEMKKEEDRPSSIIEKKEEPVLRQEQRHELPPPVQTAAKTPSIEETKPSAPPQEEEKIKREPVTMAMAIVSVSDTGSLFASPTSQSKEARDDFLPGITASEKVQNVAKYSPPSDGEIAVTKPRYAENPKPLYPREARKRGYEGEVSLRVEVLANGRVGQVEVKHSSGHEILDRSALTTVKQWRFIPAKKGEYPVPVWVNIPVKFQLQ